MLDLSLPPPEAGRNTAVFEALQRRRTIREIDARALPPGVLSALLWAAFGVNRAVGPFGQAGRTAASASNCQEIDLYVALEGGTYLYDAPGHRLTAVSGQDLRQAALTPGQRGVAATAPVQLIYVVDVRRLTHTAGFDEPGLHDPEVQKAYYFVDTGLIAGNVHLYAAAEGLAAWFHNCDRAKLALELSLGPEQHVLFAQSIGYPCQPEAGA